MALSSLGLSAVDHLALRVWEGLLLGALVNGAQSGAGQGREPRPGLGFLPWPVTQKYLFKPPLVTLHLREPQAAEGLRVGGIIIETLSFACNLRSISRSSVMKCLRIFFAIEIRVGFKVKIRCPFRQVCPIYDSHVQIEFRQTHDY